MRRAGMGGGICICSCGDRVYWMGRPGTHKLLTETDLISKDPNICGGDACLRGHRIPVWVLVNYRRHVANDADVLRAYPSVTFEGLKAALDYAAVHSDEIERAIVENETGEE
jgi:uncharacterized protein (DUF433 family)